MNDMMEKYNVACEPTTGMLTRPSLKERIDGRLSGLEKELAEMRELKSLLEKNPDFARTIELFGTKHLY